MALPTGASVVAQTLQQLGVKVVFGLVGIPVVEIAEACISLGIRFVAFRNEQAASYAASAYGYLTGLPGVCLVVGGPGVVHAMAGVSNATVNNWPLLLIAGSCETHLVGKGAFQELDAISMLTPHTKLALRPTSALIPEAIQNAYRTCLFGRNGPTMIDLPADVIKGYSVNSNAQVRPITRTPCSAGHPEQVRKVADLLRTAQAPLIVLGKGSAFSRAESLIGQLVNQTGIPFLPTPMGKGVVPDSDPLNVAAARSLALKRADIVLVLGARLNWILHFGEDRKYDPAAKIIQVDSSPEEIGRNNSSLEHFLLGDIGLVCSQLIAELQGWYYDKDHPYFVALEKNRSENVRKASLKITEDANPLTYHATFDTIKRMLAKLSPPEDNGIVYISEGANTMDVSRSFFQVEAPRLRLDAGTHATMGVGPAYAIAAHYAYNTESSAKQKKIVCLEGDSAFGFSLAEVETMSRYDMNILIFVVNNGGIYHGDSNESDAWLKLKQNTIEGTSGGLRSTSLGWEVGYEKIAEMCGGKGYLVRNSAELERAVIEGFHATVPSVVNIIIESGSNKKLVSDSERSRLLEGVLTCQQEFTWQQSEKKT
jgi:2-hydroxyacyl-CoA lyase 1